MEVQICVRRSGKDESQGDQCEMCLKFGMRKMGPDLDRNYFL